MFYYKNTCLSYLGLGLSHWAISLWIPPLKFERQVKLSNLKVCDCCCYSNFFFVVKMVSFAMPHRPLYPWFVVTCRQTHEIQTLPKHTWMMTAHLQSIFWWMPKCLCKSPSSPILSTLNMLSFDSCINAQFWVCAEVCLFDCCLLPVLCPQHQQQVVQAMERAKQVTMGELNASIGVRGLPPLPPTVCTSIFSSTFLHFCLCLCCLIRLSIRYGLWYKSSRILVCYCFAVVLWWSVSQVLNAKYLHSSAPLTFLSAIPASFWKL